jgi:hypothetical protein
MKAKTGFVAAALANVWLGPVRYPVVVKSVSTKKVKFLELPAEGNVAKEGYGDVRSGTSFTVMSR